MTISVPKRMVEIFTIHLTKAIKFKYRFHSPFVRHRHLLEYFTQRQSLRNHLIRGEKNFHPD